MFHLRFPQSAEKQFAQNLAHEDNQHKGLAMN